MKMVTFRCCILSALLCSICALSYAAPVTLLAGQSVTYSGTAVIQGTAGQYNAYSSTTFTLSADGKSLTIVAGNTNNGNDSQGAVLQQISFTVTSTAGTPVYNSSVSAIATIGGVGGGTNLWSISPNGGNSYRLGAVGGNLLSVNQSGTVVFALTGGVVQSLTFDNLVFTYVPNGTGTGVPSPVTPPAPVPEPATIALLSTGLGAMALKFRKPKK